MINKWIEKNWKELYKICQYVSKQNNPDDLCQLCVEQLMKNKKIDLVEDDQKLFFFTRIVRNNFNSNSSPYYHTYTKHKFDEYNHNKEIIDNHYEESEIDIEWVNKTLDEMEWYYMRLMKLFIEEGASISKLSKRTTIPINSVSRDINKVRRYLIKKRKEYYNGL